MAAKLTRWFFFGVTVSLLPLCIAWAILALTPSVQRSADGATLEKVIGSGELLVITWVLSGSAIGEVVGSDGKRPIAKIICGGVTFVIIIFSAGLFCWVTEAKVANQAYDAVLLATYSKWLFVLSIMSCCGCLLSAGEE